MALGHMGTWHKPSSWFERTDFAKDEDGNRTGRALRTWTSCSRECIEKLAKEQDVCPVVLPI
jgi:hypothetical protein